MKDDFLEYLDLTNSAGSRKAPSYRQALEFLDTMWESEPILLNFAPSLWECTTPDSLEELYKFILIQQKSSRGGIFQNTPKSSYWRGRFYSAAIKFLLGYVVAIETRESELNQLLDSNLPLDSISNKLEAVKFKKPATLLPDDILLDSKEGKDFIQKVKVRANQAFFRSMVLKNYNTSCCVTGLNVPEVLRASHISPWASDKPNRMNPENGLCLSATYDAAFDRHLISFDEDYRMVLSKSLKEYCTNSAFQNYFMKYEGTKIILPNSYNPSKTLLEEHCAKMV